MYYSVMTPWLSLMNTWCQTEDRTETLLSVNNIEEAKIEAKKVFDKIKKQNFKMLDKDSKRRGLENVQELKDNYPKKMFLIITEVQKINI